MTCKECLCCDVCVYLHDTESVDFEEINPLACKHFKPKSRFVELPCEVGDRVYSINIGDEKSLKIWIEPNGDRITQIKINRGGYHFKCWWGYFHLSDIGKTVFLSREEAEKALKEREKE